MFYRILSPIFEKDYLIILKALKDHADKIAIVTYYPTADNSETAIKKSLKNFHLETEWMKKWPGTISSKKARVDFYAYNQSSYTLLKKSRSLISVDQEQTIDVFFLLNGKCVFYSVIHEDIHMITNPELAEVFRALGYTLLKIPALSSKFF
ncbi:hypothetical protein LHA31_04075 [Carnobacterium viridans]|uniref:Uncharacterized protein n=1 Tax=Carnobacterium viridans TaxID=174587 RepID=A0A1H1B3W0_9LACT|nr:hypothetical protein [Carnobacterium viridans]UDE95947.1 hypothetical protein LHA31_04075 [Carnobacterium viridans]SDQ46461.1 hypothetical protein SAMN04487752_2405 [Carnobacterium viridans]